MSAYRVKRGKEFAEVTISNGTVVLVDFEDLPLLFIFPSWQLRKGHISCERWIRTPYGNVLQRVYLHRLIVGPRKKWEVDHANRNKLDNRRANLRMATRKQNSANVVAVTRSSSGYRGVTDTRRRLKKRYAAGVGGKRVGYYTTAVEAARAYDAAAKERYGSFAVLNFPEVADG